MRILELHNLKKYFATQKAVDDISFAIERGSIFGLLGPNGAGKTTLLRMITGIFYPDSGNIIFEKGLSRQDALKKIKEWFVKFEMQSWWNKKVEDLSKGMSQKLQFVTTVLHRPALLILDEPFSGLDPVNSNLIKEEIFNLAKNGTTVIFSTHRMEQVEEICDHIVLINKGKKILDGSVKQIKQDCKENHFRIGFEELPREIKGAAFEVVQTENNALIVKINEGYTPSSVLQNFLRQNAGIVSFNEILPTLNEIFIKKVEDTKVTRQFQEVT